MPAINNKNMVGKFIIIVALFFIFSASAVLVGILNEGQKDYGLINNINWLWIPSIVTFIFALLVGWVLFANNKGTDK